MSSATFSKSAPPNHQIDLFVAIHLMAFRITIGLMLCTMCEVVCFAILSIFWGDSSQVISVCKTYVYWPWYWLIRSWQCWVNTPAPLLKSVWLIYRINRIHNGCYYLMYCHVSLSVMLPSDTSSVLCGRTISSHDFWALIQYKDVILPE